MQQDQAKKSVIRYLPMYGCIATGIIYLAVGVLAMLSFLKFRDGGADESSMLAVLNDYTIGTIFIWVILVGTICYIIWRIYEMITDPYQYGKDGTGMTRRIGIGLSAIADALIAYAAIRVLLGANNIQKSGQPKEEREMVDGLLQESFGQWIVAGIGTVVLVTAIVQLYYGFSSGYKERLDIKHFKVIFKKGVHLLARTGYAARGIILGIIGFFFIKAGISDNAEHIVNTDKAFDFIGDEVGHVYFVIVAIGTICYGLFMFALGATYDTDKN